MKEHNTVNTKNLLAFIYSQMQRLSNGEIDSNTACAQAKLASQASNLLNYELKRTIVQLRLHDIRGESSKVIPRLREIESRPATEDGEKDNYSIAQILDE